MTHSLVDAGQGDPVDEMISAAVRGLTHQHRRSYSQVALAVGISKSGFHNKLNGVAPWKASEVERLARYFAVTRDDLYEGRADYRPQGRSVVSDEAAVTLSGAGARSSTDRASDYGSAAALFRRPGHPRRRRTDRRHDAVVPLYLVTDFPLPQRESA